MNKNKYFETKIKNFLTFLLLLNASNFCFSQILPVNAPVSAGVNTYRGSISTSDGFTELPNTILQPRQFVIEKISVEQEPLFIILIVTFNLPVNPQSVSYKNIQVNEQALTEETTVKFSRTGTEIHIVIPLEQIEAITDGESQQLAICVKKIRAYDGSQVEGFEIDKLEFKVNYQYAEQMWKF